MQFKHDVKYTRTFPSGEQRLARDALSIMKFLACCRDEPAHSSRVIIMETNCSKSVVYRKLMSISCLGHGNVKNLMVDRR